MDGISTRVVNPGDAVDERLAALGLSNADIDCILFSHMDFDHTSGLKHLRRANHDPEIKEQIITL